MGLITRFYGRYLGKQLDFRVRIFNVLAMAGALICVFMTIVGIVNSVALSNVLLCIFSGLLSAGLLVYCRRSGRFQLCCTITVVAIFLFLFPLMFATAGGYRGGMPSFFVFAVVFTAFMLEGRRALVFCVLELLAYVVICVLAFAYPAYISWLDDEAAVLIDTIVGFLSVGAALGITMYAQIRMYRTQQRDLEATREEALRLSQVKNIFLANMSHEIRTPINVMIGMTEMVLRESRDEVVLDYAHKIESAGRMLLVLVNNILDVSKVESGKLELRNGRYQTMTLLQELADIGAERAHRRGLAFHLRCDEDLPTVLSGDVLRLKQIGVNFLSNACKYTEEGVITLECSQKPGRHPGEILLCLTVSDTGVGIRQDSMPFLFEAFTRVDLPTHQTIEGTGLGLAITKQLAQQMDGQVFVESEYGVGSVFWVEIPQTVEDAAPMGSFIPSGSVRETETQESFTAPEAHVLLVDDNLANLQTTRALLARTLLRLDTVRSGQDCLDAVQKTHYDLILLDHMMPGLDGIETFRLLRAQPDFQTPVVALTANAIAGAEDMFLAEGFAAYLTKPVQAAVLEETLLALLPPALVTRRMVRAHAWDTAALREELAARLAPFGLRLEDGLHNASGDLVLLGHMAEIFCRRNAAAAEEVKRLFDGGDRDALLHLTHSLKSSAASVGALELSALSAQMESACRAADADLLAASLPLLALLCTRAAEGLALLIEALARTTEQEAEHG